MKNKYLLTVKQSKYLLSIIFIAIVFKIITAGDIQYSEGKIQNIDGIEFSSKTIIIKRNIYDITIDFSPEILNEKKIMSENWEKFLNTLRKQKKTII